MIDALTYVPIFLAIGFAVGLVGSRLLTNRALLYTPNRVPVWVSVVYMVGFLGLGATCVWATISIAWWAGVVVLVVYGLTRLVPSTLSNAVRAPKLTHLPVTQTAAWAILSAPKGDFDRVIADCSESIRLDPNDAEAYCTRSLAYVENGDFDNAVADCTAAIRLDAKNAKAYNNRGLAYAKKGNLDKAIADFSKAVRLNPKYADAYHNRSVAYREKGDLVKSAEDVATVGKLGHYS